MKSCISPNTFLINLNEINQKKSDKVLFKSTSTSISRMRSQEEESGGGKRFKSYSERKNKSG